MDKELQEKITPEQVIYNLSIYLQTNGQTVPPAFNSSLKYCLRLLARGKPPKDVECPNCKGSGIMMNIWDNTQDCIKCNGTGKLSNKPPLLNAEDEMLLRRLLWEHHGCSFEYLYGDDGEMQCSNPKHDLFPFTDFRRDSARLLEWKLGNEICKRILPRPDK